MPWNYLDYNPIRNDHYYYTIHRSAGLCLWASTNYEATSAIHLSSASNLQNTNYVRYTIQFSISTFRHVNYPQQNSEISYMIL